MRLSELGAVGDLHVLRDGEFASLGLLTHDAPRMLVGLYDPRLLVRECLPNPHIACVITTAEVAPRIPDRMGVAVTADPRRSFYAVHEHLRTCTDFYGRQAETVIAADARIDPAASIAERGVQIGRGSVVEARASVLPGTMIGEQVVIRAGSVIGAEGFEAKEVGGRWLVVAHTGGVVIRDNVEIQANSVVCRSLFGGSTEIAEETKLANQVGVAHNVRIGRRCRIAAGAQVSGSARLGDDVWIGPNATISNGVRVGDGARVSLGAVVVQDVASGATVSGNFAVDHESFLAAWRRMRRRRDAG